MGGDSTPHRLSGVINKLLNYIFVNYIPRLVAGVTLS